MAETALTSGVRPSRRTSPVAPHTASSIPSLTRGETACGC